MKKTTTILLAFLLAFLLLSLAACDGGQTISVPIAAATEAPATPEPTEVPTPTPVPPFGELMGWEFSEPEAMELGTTQYTDAAEAQYLPITASLTRPTITREAAEEGYVIYRVSFAETGNISFSYNMKETSSFGYVFSPRDYDAYDYYTGLELPNKDLYTEGDQTVSFEEEPCVITVDGKQVFIWYSKIMSVEWDDYVYTGLDKTHEQVDCVGHGTFTHLIKVPAEYDGIVLAICPQRLPVIDDEDPFGYLESQKESQKESQEVKYWEGNAEEWIFLRLSDLAVDQEN